ncbi:DNA repair protein RadA [Methylosinus sp. C49]|uniref:DNA repair protein RadA n=1 Tax=Methylosinus sp. C49 TaxID=2699395 RepID=UPI0013672C21|nr:DNA repair protein RadA [Methylosinus sp. C49]BBU61863.1 DNA repair protein RadA [Methylosinus sp. C49]
MAKARQSFVCQSCGAVTNRWQGRCESCNEWNTIVEENGGAGGGFGPTARVGRGRPFALEALAGDARPAPRIATGIEEFDRVTGGGFVPGSVALLGGEPGIGKSTLLIQACAALARRGERVIYISGEEAAAQVRLRAERLGLSDAPVELAGATQVEDILATCSAGKRAALIVIDSIQTMHTEAADSAPGTVTQVRASAQALLRHAKLSGSTVILVGHVTKDGQVAGPRVVEHMVDAVLSFEGDSAHHFRMLRASKNRFGATGEIGVFEMTGAGLAEVANPSALFLAGRDAAAPGAAVLAGMEGQRPMLVEIQALVAPTSLGTPRRAVVGFDSNRLSMILAVLEAHAGLKLGMHDVYLNVAGGLRADEPAADLAAAAALVSSLTGATLPAELLFFGEIALSGAVRPVIHAGARLKEAGKLGFRRAVLPQAQQTSEDDKASGVALSHCGHVASLVADIAKDSVGARERGRPQRQS